MLFCILGGAFIACSGSAGAPPAVTNPPIITSAGTTTPVIYLPATSSATLSCVATSADGTPATYSWTQKSGPATASIANATTSTATVSGMTTAGTYVFTVEVKGSNDATKTQDVTVTVGIDTTVSFVTLGSFPGTTVDFSPSTALPAGVTYTLTDNRPTPNTWSSTTPGFTGQIDVSTYSGLSSTDVTFTQAFYLNGMKITSAGSERTVLIGVDDFPTDRFTGATDSGFVTIKHP